MLPNRQEDKITIIVVISAVTNVILNYFFIPMWGASAAALITVIAELIVCMGALFYTRKYIEFGEIITMLIKIILSGITMIVTLIFISNFNINSILERFVGSIISGVVYVICLGLLNLQYFTSFLK